MALDRRRFVTALAASAGLWACAARRGSSSGAVEWNGFAPIGGIDQWISIRGNSAHNPVLLFLHGGPGEALSPFPEIFAPLRENFTVAVWDQRGAGKTFGAHHSDASEMTLERLVADTAEIAEMLKQRLGKRRIVLAGQSWGTVLGLNTVRAHPELFSAYVGTGQAVSWSRAVPIQERYARAKAEAAGDTQALQDLAAAQRLPLSDMARTAPLRRWIFPPADTAFLDRERAFVGPQPPASGPIADWVNGFGFSAGALTPYVLAFDGDEVARNIEIPIVIIQGRDDHITPFELAAQFEAKLRTRSNAFVAIDGGHFACYTNAAAFAQALTDHLRPLAR